MRPSKSRSRGKRPNNNNRSMGSVINRVFDSSGPEGKVRGTPQQIIDKYLQLHRDAQLSNDRVAAENFQQHAEHYARMLTQAQQEQDARKELQETIVSEPSVGNSNGHTQNDGSNSEPRERDRTETLTTPNVESQPVMGSASVEENSVEEQSLSVGLERTLNL
ncbi:MAG: hypothetical protein ACI8Y9_001550 [Paracoccaceae bacterium]|jgi:hypothetical protein